VGRGEVFRGLESGKSERVLRRVTRKERIHPESVPVHQYKKGKRERRGKTKIPKESSRVRSSARLQELVP